MVQQLTRPPIIRNTWLPMSWEEFLVWSPGEGQSEWVNGEGIAYMSNSARHVRLVGFVVDLLRLYVRAFHAGDVFSDSMLMRIPSRPSGQMPDIVVIRSEHLDSVKERWIDGPADFVMEFLSEDNPDRDLIEKRHEFERAGVPEYVIADARPGGQEFVFLRLDESRRYQDVQPDGLGRYHSEVLPGFWIDPSWFQLDTLPNPMTLFRRMAPEAWRQLMVEIETEG